MRHTLLPLHERILLRREYHIRVTIVFLFMVCLAILIGISSLFMTYIKALSLETEIQEKANAVDVDKDSKDIKEIQQSVVKSLALLDSLNKEKKVVQISDLIGGVIAMRGQLRFTALSASKVGTTTYNISIQGVAPTRNSLLAFKSTFEGLAPGNKVDLPVSELAKSTNIQFSLQLKQELP